MGICNVLAILPFLCSAPAEEPAEEEQVIQSSPAVEVEMGTLAPPPGSAVAPAPERPSDANFDVPPAPSMRAVSDYEVLPPSGTADVAYTPPADEAESSDENVGSFSEWVNRNWGEDTGN